jgi:hypothetical protein
MYANCNGNSGYARADGEIYNSLSRAGFRVFSATVKEFRGFFIKFDEMTLTLAPDVQEYALPVDCSQIVHLAERESATNDWMPIDPMDIDSALINIQRAVGWSDSFAGQYGHASQFGFYGPYLDSAASIGVQTQKIRIAPKVSSARFVQIVYTAKWIPITDASSKVMLPDEGTYAMESWASAELCGKSDDSRMGTFNAQGDKDLTSYLAWARERQIMQRPGVEMYGPGF